MLRNVLVVVCVVFPGWIATLHGQEMEDAFTPELPSPARLFRLESEAHARERWSKERGKEIEFPETSRPPFAHFDPARDYPPQEICVLPSVVCHRPLYFEDPKTERELRSCGIFEPVRSSLLFYTRAITLPVRMVIIPPWSWECHQN